MARNTDQIMGHAADNDGIEEYDNPLPDWWLGLFFFTIVFGIGYAIDYHFIAQTSQQKLYLAEMEEAEKLWPTPEGGVEVVMSPEAIAAGKTLFADNCASCHGADLSGGIGPNLKDSEWIHGGEPADIVRTITEGVPSKGMLTWGPILGPQRIAQVAAFVIDSYTGEAPAKPAAGAAVADAAPEEVDMSDPVAAGEAIFTTNCVSCHNADLTGGVGPNLIDTEWIHGGTEADIKKTITEGVPEKGMLTWGPILGEEKINAVTQYILSKNAAANGAEG